MDVKRIQQVYFSATGTTKTIVEQVGQCFEGERFTLDLLRQPLTQEQMFDSEDVLIVGMPVYAGRIPVHCAEMLKFLQGNDTPAVVVVGFGNRHYDDALLELKEQMTTQGFKVFAAGAFVTQHSIFPVVGEGRPNASDLKDIQSFGSHSALLVKRHDLSEKRLLRVLGDHPYREAAAVPLKPKGDKTCIKCNACVNLCPMKAIPADDPTKTDTDLCISCAACIDVCPTSSRAFRGMVYSTAKKVFVKKNSTPKESEVFYSEKV